MKTSDFNLSSDAQQVLGAIRSIGARPVLVGGCVRDRYMGRLFSDIDIEVHNLQDMDSLISALKTIGRVDEVGKSFGVLKVGPLGKIDVSLPRRDSKIAEGHRGFTVEVDPTMTLEEAAGRRDFTMNAMMFDPFTETLIDPYRGQLDIDLGILRHTTKAFSEDPLRVLRAVQFSARLGFGIASETAELCRELTSSFEELANERVWGEWEKILKSGTHFVMALDVLRKAGWIEFFPELQSVVGGNTDSVAEACDLNMVNEDLRAILVLASLTLDSRYKEIKSIGASKSILTPASKIAAEAAIARRNTTGTAMRKMARRLHPFSIEHVCMVLPYGSGPVYRAANSAGVFEKPILLPINGDDLIAKGFQPGKIFTEILQRLTTELDEGRIFTRTEALEWLDANYQDER
jgi:tRNA nucleotidyltransferase (CCA-adding enzyme)